MTRPALPSDLSEALTEAAQSDRLLVASDFDGVLAPFVVDPMDSRAQEGTLEDIAALGALPGTDAALVSGRDLATLTRLTAEAGEGVTRLGSHGAQSSRQGPGGLDGSAAGHLAALDVFVTSELALLGRPVRREDKPAAVVLHTREADPSLAAAVEEVAARAADLDGVRLLRGKSVFELSVVEADKGTALLALADELGSDVLVYLGDDVTDEHVFEAARAHDVTIKVGEGQTSARYRVAGCEDVPEVLRALRAARATRDS